MDIEIHQAGKQIGLLGLGQCHLLMMGAGGPGIDSRQADLNACLGGCIGRTVKMGRGQRRRIGIQRPHHGKAELIGHIVVHGRDLARTVAVVVCGQRIRAGQWDAGKGMHLGPCR